MPEESRAALGGIQCGSIDFSVEFANVNGDQEIEAPANARPLSELTGSLGGALGALGARLGRRGAAATPGPREPNGAGDGRTPEAQDFKDYADCLDKARPEDTEALQRCADLLQRP